jgi:PII-like signaling protein
MELRSAKKVVIITEAAIEEKIIRVIEAHGAKGYTVYRDITGKGSRGIRAGSGGLSTFGENVMIETIVATLETAKAIMDEIVEKYLASKYAGIVYLDDVQVERIERF